MCHNGTRAVPRAFASQPFLSTCPGPEVLPASAGAHNPAGPLAPPRPRQVVSTQPLSAVSRHTAVFPPLPHLLAGAPHASLPPAGGKAPVVPRCLDPMEIVCQLEGSGRWPDSVAAFLRMKAALGVQLAQALAASYALEAQAAEGGYVDVLSEGFAFRLLLATERDAAMQQKALAMGGLQGRGLRGYQGCVRGPVRWRGVL